MIKVVILAGGKGKRINSDLPKPLIPIKNKPMIEHLIRAVIKSGIDKNPIVVVSPKNKKLFKKFLGKYNIKYAIQKNSLGTGHALHCALREIGNNVSHVISLYGDHPFVKSETIKKLGRANGSIAMVTVNAKNFAQWKKCFYHWGRIIRKERRIVKIIEFKDAKGKVKRITEVNSGFYNFEAKWLKKNIGNIKNKNVQKEYYITDLIELAFDQKLKINSFLANPKEAVGINTPEELEMAEKLV